jgi:hypothetical protein
MEIDSPFDIHPIGLIPHLRESFGDDLILHFSRYAYVPRDRKDKRELFSLPISEVTPNWLHSELLKLGPLYELALHSNVDLGSKKRHIPMLDFRGMTKGQLTAVMDIFPGRFSEGLQVYFSGRSYHAYFPKLLTHGEWIKFMGSALLCNSPNDTAVVDQRWVGHRLIGGYSALRWSCNTSHYKRYPELIDINELDKAFVDRRTNSGVIRGVSRTGPYFEELVELALKEVGVKYFKGLVTSIGLNSNNQRIDFVATPPNANRIAIEATYCKERYLTNTQVNNIGRLITSIRKTDKLTKFLVITNGHLKEDDKDFLAASGIQMYFFEECLNPSDLTARLKKLLLEDTDP